MSRVPNPTVDSSPDEVEIEYHVILSATYNVPILYVVRASRAGRILSMDSKSIPELLAQLVAPLHGSHGSDFSGALTMMVGWTIIVLQGGFC